VVSFETIEHISQHATFVAEIKRVLRPGGVLVISSPDKMEYSERLGVHNPYHVGELYRGNFLGLLGQHFRNCLPMQQRMVGGSYIAADNHKSRPPPIYGTYRGDFLGGTFTEGVHEGIYCVAVCSDGPLPKLRLGLFENRLYSAQMWNLFETAPQRATEIQEFRDRLRTLGEQLPGGEKELAATKRVTEQQQMEALRNECEAARASVAQSESKLLELSAEVVRRGEWGRGLERELVEIRVNLAERKNAEDQMRLREEALQSEKKTRLELQSALQEARFAAEAGQQKMSFAHDVERRSWREQMQGFETEIAKQRERAESSELTVVSLRAEVERKHEQARDLTMQRLANEREVERIREELEKEKGERSGDERKRNVSHEESLSRYEQQLLASQTQLAAALAECQRAMLWGNTVAEQLRHERTGSAERPGHEHELMQMKTSWSWRLTAPLRRIHQALGDPLYRRKS